VFANAPIATTTSAHRTVWLMLADPPGGAAWVTRTPDPRITNAVLYRLS
jgi:hypothetical protein